MPTSSLYAGTMTVTGSLLGSGHGVQRARRTERHDSRTRNDVRTTIMATKAKLMAQSELRMRCTILVAAARTVASRASRDVVASAASTVWGATVSSDAVTNR